MSATPGALAAAVADLAAGRPVLLCADDEEPASLSDLVVAGSRADPSAIAFVVRHTSGFVCAAMGERTARRLGLPLMSWPEPGASPDLAYGVTVDAVEHVSTGISATDRARTIRTLADPRSRRDQLARPGHVIPVLVRAAEHRPSRPAAAVELVRAAGLGDVAAMASLVSPADPLRMATATEARAFGEDHGLAVITRRLLADLGSVATQLPA